MEAYYKQVPDGVKVPFNEARILLELIQTAYQSLSLQGTLTQEQIQLCETFKNIIYLEVPQQG